MNSYDLHECVYYPKYVSKELMLISITFLMDRLEINDGWNKLNGKYGNNKAWSKELTHKILVTIYKRFKHIK